MKPTLECGDGRSTLRLQYAPALRRTMVKPLEHGDSGVPQVIEVHAVHILDQGNVLQFGSLQRAFSVVKATWEPQTRIEVKVFP